MEKSKIDYNYPIFLFKYSNMRYERANEIAKYFEAIEFKNVIMLPAAETDFKLLYDPNHNEINEELNNNIKDFFKSLEKMDPELFKSLKRDFNIKKIID